MALTAMGEADGNSERPGDTENCLGARRELSDLIVRKSWGGSFFPRFNGCEN
jgi:hypothetical protein